MTPAWRLGLVLVVLLAAACAPAAPAASPAAPARPAATAPAPAASAGSPSAPSAASQPAAAPAGNPSAAGVPACRARSVPELSPLDQYGLHWAGPFDRAGSARQESAVSLLTAGLSAAPHGRG